MKTLHVWNAAGTGWHLFWSRPWYLFGLAVAYVGLVILSRGNGVFTALAAVMYAGYFIVMLRVARGEAYQFDDLFSVDRRWIYLAFTIIIKAMLILLGLACFIIPGVYLMVRWMFAELIVVDQGLRPLEALRASSELTAGHRWSLFGLTLLLILMIMLGVVVFVIGIFAAIPIVTLTVITAYDELHGPNTPPLPTTA